MIDHARLMFGATLAASFLLPVSPSLGAGQNHNCFIADGTAFCSGYNAAGQLGNNTLLTSASPTAVYGGLRFTKIVEGANHTCGVAGGAVYCWGHNSHGEVGDVSTTNRKVPTLVQGLPAGLVISSLSAGEHHTCAVAGVEAYCWGYNNNGQLGDGTKTTRLSAGRISALDGIAASISAGQNHTCALTTNSRILCWGLNSSGQLGNKTLVSSSVPVTTISSGAQSVSVGANHSCAITNSAASSAREVRCWGANAYGQVGDGTVTNRTAPVLLPSIVGASEIAAGAFHTCIANFGDQLMCWGRNNVGQLGLTPGSPANRTTPTSIFSQRVVEDLKLGYNHTCYAAGMGSCFGYNGYGLLGNSSTANTNFDTMQRSKDTVSRLGALPQLPRFPDLPGPRINFKAVYIPSTNKILIIGGSTSAVSKVGGYERIPSDDIIAFDLTTQTYTAVGKLLNKRDSFAATLLSNGKILVSGGVTTSTSMNSDEFAAPTASAELLDPQTFSSLPLPNMVVPRQQHAQVPLADGRVLIAGGSYSDLRVEIFDPATNSLSLNGSQIYPRVGLRSYLTPSGDVYLLHGFGGPASAPPNSSLLYASKIAPRTIELYDPLNSHPSYLVPLAAARYGSVGVVPFPSGNVLLVGGGTPTAERVNTFIGTDRYPMSMNFTSDPNSLTSSVSPGSPFVLAALYGTGVALFPVSPGFVRWFDTKSGRYAAVARVNQARYGAEVLSLPDGRTLILGGNAGSTFAPSRIVEVFNPSAITAAVPEEDICFARCTSPEVPQL